MPRFALRRPRTSVSAILGVLLAGAGNLEPAWPVFQHAEATLAVTLPEALALARRHQPDLAVAAARLQAAEAATAIPGAEWQPRVGAMAQVSAATANNSSSVVQQGGIVALPRVGGTQQTVPGSLVPQASTVLAVGLRQNIYDFGRIAAQKAVAAALVEFGQRRSDEVMLAVAAAVEDAFYAVLAAQAVRTTAHEAWARSQTHAAAARAGLAAGLRSAADVARAEADAARFEIGVIRAHGGLLAAQAVLAAAIGSDAQAVDAVGSLTAAASEDLPAGMHPQVRALAAAQKLQEAQAAAIARELRPAIFLGASFSGRAGGVDASNGTVPVGRGFVPAVLNWDVGVVFSAPLHDGVVRARRRAAAAEAKAAQAEVVAATQQWTVRVQAARISLEVAERSLEPLQRALSAAQRSAKIADARFAQGLGTGLEVADAAALLVDAEVSLILGQFAVARGRAVLRREQTGAP